MELYELTVHELLDKLDKKEITSKDIVESYIKRIEEKEKDVDAFVTLTTSEALEKSKTKCTKNISHEYCQNSGAYRQ